MNSPIFFSPSPKYSFSSSYKVEKALRTASTLFWTTGSLINASIHSLTFLITLTIASTTFSRTLITLLFSSSQSWNFTRASPREAVTSRILTSTIPSNLQRIFRANRRTPPVTVTITSIIANNPFKVLLSLSAVSSVMTRPLEKECKVSIML